ncbi:SRPBCC family protein [Streptacidiphilus fuscans]|uniref:Carbon monoxide dehydrogenase subunit G n=1 Tax=Streptacidiphilus fuscans TaxID=2789292 RepID=A0A931AZF0_9ACTN|nr:hypothetical protein [Streptacidiphilus fuscans]MBF9068350.1 hypothetical protein [Streptacidiphilus fuscans]
MEHEVLVPLSPRALQRSLGRSELLAVCLPGFTPDQPATDGAVPEVPAQGDGSDAAHASGTPLLAGRLKLRVGSSSITYRGRLRRLDDNDADSAGGQAFEVDGEQSVGSGSITGTVRVRLEPLAEDAFTTRVVFLTTLQGKGRIEEFSSSTLATAGRRLLDRFCAELSTRAERMEDLAAEADEADAPDEADATDETDAAETSDPLEEGFDDDAELFLVQGFGELNDLSDLGDLSELGDLGELGEPATVESARRSMVGRSAEEVDHAPPRGRYAPVLAPRSARSRASARWGTTERRMGEPPVAELERPRTPWLVGGGVALLGGAFVLVRALRRHSR